jgi:PilZ domain
MNALGARIGRARLQRVAQRASVLMPVSVVTMNAYQFPELLNISHTGAKLRGCSLPPKNTTGLLKIGMFQTLCRVVWVDAEQCGVRFDEPVPSKVLKQIQLEGAISGEMLTQTEQRAKDEWVGGQPD